MVSDAGTRLDNERISSTEYEPYEGEAMMDQHALMAEMERQGEAAGKATAERDFKANKKPERVESLDALQDDAWAAAWKAVETSGEPYGDDFKMAEQAFADAFTDAYLLRWDELTGSAVDAE